MDESANPIYCCCCWVCAAWSSAAKWDVSNCSCSSKIDPDGSGCAGNGIRTGTGSRRGWFVGSPRSTSPVQASQSLTPFRGQASQAW